MSRVGNHLVHFYFIILFVCTILCKQQANSGMSIVLYIDVMLFFQTFQDCACVTGPLATAKLGQCKSTCNMIYAYLAILFITQFVTSMMMVPVMTTFLR